MPTPKESLISTHQLLHLTHHRNKNQHRLSKWYKWFSILRRQISKLITELETLETAEAYSSKNKREENKYVKAARERVEVRVAFLREQVIGDAYLAFSNLVADNQYSALGLVLLGSLARVKSVLGQLVRGEKEVNIEVVEEAKGGELQRSNARDDDLGEPVKREQIPDFEDSWHAVEGEEEGENQVVEKEEEGEVEEEQPAVKGIEETRMPRPRKKRGASRINKNIVEERGDNEPDEEAQRRENEDEWTGGAPQKLTMENLLRLEVEQPGPRINNHKRAPKAVVGSNGPRKKRKKGKGDAFDDLFSSLI
jgi:ribonuclease MRP protein subunit RMP1